MVSDPADDILVSREIEQPCGTGRCSACSAVFSSARALMAGKATCCGLRTGLGFTWCYQAVRALLMVAIAYTVCRACMISLACLRCFSRQLAHEDTALRPCCGRNETGDGLIPRQRRGIGRFRRLPGQSAFQRRLCPLLKGRVQVPRLRAFGIGDEM